MHKLIYYDSWLNFHIFWNTQKSFPFYITERPNNSTLPQCNQDVHDENSLGLDNSNGYCPVALGRSLCLNPLFFASITPRPSSTEVLIAETRPTSSKMTKIELNQRQPLLPMFKKRERDYTSEKTVVVESGVSTSDVETDNDEEPPPQLTETEEKLLYPKEPGKTALALVLMLFTFLLSCCALAVIHDNVPEREYYAPLPDVFLSNIEEQRWALTASELLIIFSASSTLITMIFHKYKFIVFRRIFLIMTLLYLYRSITMSITILPIASEIYYCCPQQKNATFLIMMKRVLYLMSGIGLSVNGRHTYCGDYIFSGHTVVLVLSYLLMSEYTSKRLYLLHWVYALVALVGIFLVLLAHGHYSIDCLIGYYITSRIFWTYHLIANNRKLKKINDYNYLAREWWYVGIHYFERNIGRPLPCKFVWPLPWPKRCFRSKD